MTGAASDYTSGPWMQTVAAALPRPPTVTIPREPELESTLIDLRDSGLMARLEAVPLGFSVRLDNAEELCASPREAAVWLTRVATERYPQSNFAKRRG